MLTFICFIDLQFVNPETLNDMIRLLLSHKKTNSKTGLLPMNICGQISSESRIIGGTSAKLYEFPWMALLQIDKCMCPYLEH